MSDLTGKSQANYLIALQINRTYVRSPHFREQSTKYGNREATPTGGERVVWSLGREAGEGWSQGESNP